MEGGKPLTKKHASYAKGNRYSVSAYQDWRKTAPLFHAKRVLYV